MFLSNEIHFMRYMSLDGKIEWLRHYFQVDIASIPETMNLWEIKVYPLTRKTKEEKCLFVKQDEDLNLLLLEAAQAMYEKYA